MANSTQRTIMLLSAIFFAGALTIPASHAQNGHILTPKSTAAREYAACMAIARSNPRAAHESALAWRKKGGGNAAIHCIAVALLGMGQYSQAPKGPIYGPAFTDNLPMRGISPVGHKPPSGC